MVAPSMSAALDSRLMAAKAVRSMKVFMGDFL
jgi:hypothetical protein